MQDARRHATLGQPCFPGILEVAGFLYPAQRPARVPVADGGTDVLGMADSALRGDGQRCGVRPAQIAQLRSDGSAVNQPDSAL